MRVKGIEYMYSHGINNVVGFPLFLCYFHRNVFCVNFTDFVRYVSLAVCQQIVRLLTPACYVICVPAVRTVCTVKCVLQEVILNGHNGKD